MSNLMNMSKLGTTPFEGRPPLSRFCDRQQHLSTPGPDSCSETPSIARYSTLSPVEFRLKVDQPSSRSAKSSASRTSSTSMTRVCNAAAKSRVLHTSLDRCGANRKRVRGAIQTNVQGIRDLDGCRLSSPRVLRACSVKSALEAPH